MGERLNRVLTNDPGIGIARHADAGYDEAKTFALKKGIKLIMDRQQPNGDVDIAVPEEQASEVAQNPEQTSPEASTNPSSAPRPW